MDECKENRAYARSDNRLHCNSRTGSSVARRRLIRRSLKTPRARYANQRDRAFSLPGGLHQPNEATDGKRTRQLPVAVSAWRLSPRRYIAHRHVLALTSRHRRTPRERGASTCNVASRCAGLAPGACDVGRRCQQHLISTRKRRGTGDFACCARHAQPTMGDRRRIGRCFRCGQQSRRPGEQTSPGP